MANKRARFDGQSARPAETERDLQAEHQLQPINTSLYMCRCGQAFFGCENVHHARTRLAQHIQCVKEIHDQVRQEQSAGDLDDHHTDL